MKRIIGWPRMIVYVLGFTIFIYLILSFYDLFNPAK